MSTRDIQETLKELYGVDVDSSLVSLVTESVLEEVKLWQSRPLARIDAVLVLDCIFVKARENNTVVNKAVYVAN